MRYKAIIFDVDGTLIPNKKEGLPSQKVIDAVSRAQEKTHVGVATARPLFAIKKILMTLKLSGPSIINGGAQIINAKTKKILWEKAIEKSDALAICHLLLRYSRVIYISDGERDIQFSDSYVPQKPFQIFVEAQKEEVAREIIETISQIPRVSCYSIVSWTKGKFDVVMNHAEATKLHGVFEVAKILKIHPKEIIGVGNGYNDFPLLSACGLKISMEDAPAELKEIADYIAPPVEEDGVVDIIKKFVLKS